MKHISKLIFLSLCFVSHFTIFAQDTQVLVDNIHDSKEIATKVSSAIVGIRAVVVREIATFSGKERRLFHYYGTGVLVSSEGFVLTNITVVPESPYLITLFLADGRIVPGKYINSSANLETTLLKAEGDNFPYLGLGDSKRAQVGDRVYTFANPFHSIENDAQVAISKGIISGIYNVTDNVEAESTYRRVVLETSAALNPGSDGGPLVNHNGEVLGILSLAMQKERRLGTAIPIHLITSEIPEMKNFSLAKYNYQHFDAEQTIAQKAIEKSESLVGIEIIRNKITTSQNKKQTKEQIMEYPESLVSGIVVDNGNYVLTSAYSITHNPKIKKIMVYLGNKASEAKLISLHLPYDLALLKLDNKFDSSFDLDTKQNLQLADWIGVCGRMKSSSSITLNTGIISAVKRNYNLIHVYQTQAFINYANMGGAILDIDGNIVGIATHISPDVIWGLNSGVSIFTSIDMIQKVFAEMKEGKSTEYSETPFLGVSFWDKKVPQGALISSITMDSAAYKAGVLPGDILISLDKTLIGEWADLVRLITSKEIGQKIEFEVIRSGKTIKLEAILGPRPR